MLRLLGSAHRRQGQLDRRAFLRASAVGLGGLGGAATLGATSVAGGSPANGPPGFGRARRCLVLYIYGAWSQLDTFDPKPQAPAEIRGDFGAIDTCLPGVQVCEHLPRSAQYLDRCTLVRSMSHPWNIHAAAYTLTGNPETELIEGRQRHPDHWPYIGGVVDYLGGQGQLGPLPRGVPTNILLPWQQSRYARPNKRAGTFGGFLGPAYDPLCTEFKGEAPLGDPFRAITPDGRFSFGEGDDASLTLDALDRRWSLLEQFERQAAELNRAPAMRGYSRQRELAMEFLATPKVRDALRLEQEPDPLRESYGLTLFGQACLTARRLLEADARFVTVLWDEFGQTDESWDTHYDHHARLKEFLLPAFDRAFSTLLMDLDQRGLLEDTLVLCLSEHGRTPRFFKIAAGAPGRDHWSRAYSQLFAGAGVPRGQVIGASDSVAADVVDRPVDPKDILQTAYHLLGVNVEQRLLASTGRPSPLIGGGRIVPELLGA